MNLRVGQQIGHYILGGVLAKGGMGVVWRAWDSEFNRDVAIKVVADKLINVSDFEARFSDEVRRHSRLDHPNIVAVFDVFKFEGNFCMVMNLVQGISLETLLKNAPEHRLEVPFACDIIKEVLAALDYAHRMGIVHRDVKPSNILLDLKNHPHLTDFGIAVAVGEDRRTRTGIAIGTSVYMSPEQIRTPRAIDHRTDVYSVGCMFYEMLTGRPPFVAKGDARGDSDFLIKSAHIREQPLAPRTRVASIPIDLSDLVLRALKKNPDERIAGCGQFLRLISNAGASHVAVDGHGGFRFPVWRALLALCVLVLLVAVILIINSVWR